MVNGKLVCFYGNGNILKRQICGGKMAFVSRKCRRTCYVKFAFVKLFDQPVVSQQVKFRFIAKLSKNVPDNFNIYAGNAMLFVIIRPGRADVDSNMQGSRCSETLPA